MRGLLFSSGGLLHACWCMQHRSRLQQNSHLLEGCVKMLPGCRRTCHSPCAVHWVQLFSVSIHYLGNLSQLLQVLPKIFTLNTSLISNVTAQSRNLVRPGISFSLAACCCPESFLIPSHLPLGVQSSNLKIILWAQFLPYIFSIPIFSSFLDEINKTRGTETVSESRNIARKELPS